MNKKQLGIVLSWLKIFDKPKVKLEQYQTDSEIASDALWYAFMNGDIEDKVVADLGCGTGIFGLGAAVLGAKKVYLIDVDKEAIVLAKENKKILEKELKIKLDCTFLNKDIRIFEEEVDIVIQNPPFGVQKSHSDKVFLQKAIEISPIIYSFHKIESKNFIQRFSEDHGYVVKGYISLDFPLRNTLFFHKKRVHVVEVGFWKIERFKKQIR